MTTPSVHQFFAGEGGRLASELMRGDGDRGGCDRYEPRHLVAHAIAAHLEGAPSRGRTGRQEFAERLDIAESNLVARLNGTADKVFECARDLELHGFAEHGRVVRLARQLGLGREQWDVAPTLWPLLRTSYGLGELNRAPRFASTADVITAAEAFAAHYRVLLRRPPNKHIEKHLQQGDMIACEQLVSQLGVLASGPYGRARECSRLIATLLPLAPDVVAAMVRRGGPAAQLVRTFDASGSASGWNNHIKQTFGELLVRPPEKLVRRSYWMRALRRFRLADFRPGVTEPASRTWVTTQLAIAMRGELAYAGARRWERRAALWMAGELTLEDESWALVQASASGDPVLADLLPLVDEMRGGLAALPLTQRAHHLFEPVSGWPHFGGCPLTDTMLDPDAARNPKWTMAKHWKWARPSTRVTATHLMRDAVFGPCSVRQRMAIDTLRGAGPCAANAAANSIGAVFEAEVGSPWPNPLVLERCLTILGGLGSSNSVPILQYAVQQTDDAHLFAQAALSAHELAQMRPADAVGLMAFVRRGLNDWIARNPTDEELAVIGIRAAVVARHAPQSWLPALSANSPTVELMLAWAERTLADPLLFERMPL